jgi:pimeloyl-ACP methyl ester carboxylesterase
VLEPFQEKATLEGSVVELRDVLKEKADLPITLTGFSWGTMLSLIFTARYPQFVKKLILIGVGPYEEQYTENIMKTRMIRRGKEDLENFLLLTEALKILSAKNRNEALCIFGNLLSKSDTHVSIPSQG